ncbi:MAG: hypothetical protein RIA10_09675 [Amphiplicatus sp.]
MGDGQREHLGVANESGRAASQAGAGLSGVIGEACSAKGGIINHNSGLWGGFCVKFDLSGQSYGADKQSINTFRAKYAKAFTKLT